MEHRNRNYPQAYQACLIYHLTQKIATNATRPFLTKQPGNLRIHACNGPLDSAERRRSNDDDNNTSQFSAYPDHRQDRSAIADNCSQTGAAISITRTITTANLTTNETTLQFMHYRAHCDLVDACQRAVFFSDDFPQEVDSLSFQIANSTAVSISLPTIQKEMNLEPEQMQWIMSAYPLSSVSKALCQLAGQNSNHQCRFYVLPTWTLLTSLSFYKFSRVASSWYAVD